MLLIFSFFNKVLCIPDMWHEEWLYFEVVRISGHLRNPFHFNVKQLNILYVYVKYLHTTVKFYNFRNVQTRLFFFFGDFYNTPFRSGTYGIQCGGFYFPVCSGEECDHVHGCPTKSMLTRTAFPGSYKRQDIILSAFYHM